MARRKVEIEDKEEEAKSFADVLNALIEWIKNRKRNSREVTKLNEILSDEE